MAVKTGIIFCTLLLGSLAVPLKLADDDQVTEDLSIFFQTFDSSARIVGGSVAAEGSHPWMVAMSSGLVFRSFVCGGSVLTARTVLTAAHCVDAARIPIIGTLRSSLRVTVGTNRWNQGGQSLSVSSFVNHELYNPRTIKYDLGLLFTSTPIRLGGAVAAVPVAFDHVGGGIQTRAAGWGQTSANGAASRQLLEVNLPTLTGEECSERLRQFTAPRAPPPLDSGIELCTLYRSGVGTCRGDSGSALVRVSDGAQVGAVSWGFPCARGAPDVFVRLQAFRDWLEKHTRE